MINLLTYKEVTEKLRISRFTLMRILKEGKIKPIYLSKRMPRITENALQQYIENLQIKK